MEDKSGFRVAKWYKNKHFAFVVWLDLLLHGSLVWCKGVKKKVLEIVEFVKIENVVRIVNVVKILNVVKMGQNPSAESSVEIGFYHSADDVIILLLA